MKVKFTKQTTADFLDHHYDAPEVYADDKTFYAGQIIECDHIEETIHNFVDIIFSNGNVVVGVPKESLIIL
jgi:hypothetical protein